MGILLLSDLLHSHQMASTLGQGQLIIPLGCGMLKQGNSCNWDMQEVGSILLHSHQMASIL